MARDSGKHVHFQDHMPSLAAGKRTTEGHPYSYARKLEDFDESLDVYSIPQPSFITPATDVDVNATPKKAQASEAVAKPKESSVERTGQQASPKRRHLVRLMEDGSEDPPKCDETVETLEEVEEKTRCGYQSHVTKATQKKFSEMSLPELQKIFDAPICDRGPSIWTQKRHYTALELGAYITAIEKENYFLKRASLNPTIHGTLPTSGIIVKGVNKHIIPNDTYGHYYPPDSVRSFRELAKEYEWQSMKRFEDTLKWHRRESSKTPLTLDDLIQQLRDEDTGAYKTVVDLDLLERPGTPPQLKTHQTTETMGAESTTSSTSSSEDAASAGTVGDSTCYVTFEKERVWPSLGGATAAEPEFEPSDQDWELVLTKTKKMHESYQSVRSGNLTCPSLVTNSGLLCIWFTIRYRNFRDAKDIMQYDMYITDRTAGTSRTRVYLSKEALLCPPSEKQPRDVQRWVLIQELCHDLPWLQAGDIFAGRELGVIVSGSTVPSSHVLSASFELDQKYSTPLVTSQRVPQPVTTAADDAPLKAQPGKAVEKPRRTTDSGVQSQAENLSLPSSCSQSTGDASSSSDHGDNDFASIINAAENLSLPSSCSQSISDGSASTDHGDNHSDDGKEG